MGFLSMVGGAVNAMTELVRSNSLELVEPVVEAQFAPGAGEMGNADSLAEMWPTISVKAPVDWAGF